MITAIIFIIIGIFSFGYGFVGLLNNIEGFLWELIGGVIFGVLGILMLQKEETPPAPKDAVIEPHDLKMYDCEIAGTMSEESQGILRNVYLDSQHDETNCVTLEDDIYISGIEDSGKAYIVCYKGELLGNVPPSSLDDFAVIYDRICFNKILINWFTDSGKRIYIAHLVSYYR